MSLADAEIRLTRTGSRAVQWRSAMGRYLRSLVVSGLLVPGLMVLLGTGLVPLRAGAENPDREAVFGVWASSGTLVEIKPAGLGLSAKIVALKNPNWREKDGVGRIGQPKSDLHNPDEASRDRPLIGLEMLEDFQFRKGRWRGRLYLPSNGTSWTSTVWVKQGRLMIRGYLGISLFGRTQAFEALASCNENVLRMIRNAGMTSTPCDAMLAEAAP
jgi:uncharacterized protein (DUF2147 family)